MADPNRSPVYSDVFNYLVKTFSLCYFSLGFRYARKHFQMVGPQNLHFIKYNYSEGILCPFKMIYKTKRFFRVRLFVHKISHVQKGNVCIWQGIHLYAAACFMTLRFTILSSFLSTRNLRIDKNYTLSIFILSGSIQFYFNIQFNWACINYLNRAYYINIYSCYSLSHAFIFTIHLLYHNMRFQCNNSIYDI